MMSGKEGKQDLGPLAETFLSTAGTCGLCPQAAAGECAKVRAIAEGLGLDWSKAQSAMRGQMEKASEPPSSDVGISEGPSGRD